MLRSIMMLISILAVTLNGAPASASPPPRLVQAEVDGVLLNPIFTSDPRRA